jgi:hypothetical protein
MNFIKTIDDIEYNIDIFIFPRLVYIGIKSYCPIIFFYSYIEYSNINLFTSQLVDQFVVEELKHSHKLELAAFCTKIIKMKVFI